MSMTVYMKARGQPWVSFLSPLTQSSTDLGLTNYTTLTSEPKGTLSSLPPSTGIRKICYRTLLF